jgi:hypothetical protein
MVLWYVLQDVERAEARAALDRFAAADDARGAALQARTSTLVEIGSRATFPSGLARIDGVFVPVTVAVTDDDFVLLDARAVLDPTTELGRIPRATVAGVEVVDAHGEPVADEAIDPVRELEHPPEGYTLVLRRADAGGTLPSVGFLFRSGEPALTCRDRFRAHVDGPG